ncbi:MAG: hypothetical protein ACREBM_00250, partial [Sphingomicrobium sp.]
MSLASRYDRLPTAAKLFLILSLVMLPIGLALTWLGSIGIQQAQTAKRELAVDRGQLIAKAVESLVARNALALRVAANGALVNGAGGACERAARSLSIAPAVARNFELETIDGATICTVGRTIDTAALPLVAPGAVSVAVVPGDQAIAVRIGVIGGMATDSVTMEEIRAAARESGTAFDSLVIRNEDRQGMLTVQAPPPGSKLDFSEWPIGTGQVVARIGTRESPLTLSDQLLLLLPVLMWVAAALITWSVVSRLLIRPLRLL